MSTILNTTTTTAGLARVEQPDGTKLPVLTKGTITPSALREFEIGCRKYFMHKKIPDGDKVRTIAFGILDPLIMDWYLGDQDTIDSWTFPEYIASLRLNCLEQDWDILLRKEILSSSQGDRPFFEWSNEVRAKNNLLASTHVKCNDVTLRSHLDANMNTRLAHICIKEKTNNVVAFLAWIKEVNKHDIERIHAEEASKAWATDMYKINRAQEAVSASAAVAVARNTRNNSSRSRTGPNTASSSSTTSATSSIPVSEHLPRLTDDERTILNENQGCVKCRKCFAGHRADTCPNGFPAAATYHTLTAADATRARPSSQAGASTATRTTNVVAAVGMNAPSSVLEGEGSDTYVYPPLHSEHFYWDCLIDGPFSSDIRINTLVDNGCTTVLIDEILATSLGLKRHRLNSPETVELAMKENDGKKKIELKEWVKISLSSPDHQWKSRSVRAIVAPGLCAPVIVGLSWLTANRIVVDHELRTAIDKSTGFDILNPPPSSGPPKPPPSRTNLPKLGTIRNLHREVIKQLNDILPRRRADVCRMQPTSTVKPSDFVGAIRTRVENLALQEKFSKMNAKMMERFADRFTGLPHTDLLPTDVYHRVQLKNPNEVIACRGYSCPRKYQAAWDTLIQQHLDAGRIRPSTSPYASPAFIVPKADKTALPRWVNDYRKLNANTIVDTYPLPRIDDILHDCAKGKIWGKIDMTNSFFQTRMHPDDIQYTAVITPRGAFEWLVMPMGFRNSPSTHQRCVNAALRKLIGKICHVYLDDIVIWSQTLEEHETNVALVLEALREAHLLANPKKTDLFTTELDFLGHHISARGIEPDATKVQRILDWVSPRTSSDVRAFLGLVQYIASFLPKLAEFTSVLTPLTTKECDAHFPPWTDAHEAAFLGIKDIVTGADCLTTIDHDDPGDNKIFVTCDASDIRTGAVLSFGKTWETARPVAYDSMQLNSAQRNYPVHERKLLAIVRALAKWRVDLLGANFVVYTDHRTLEAFDTQRDLSRRQCRWQEFLAQYNFDIIYIKGEDNTVADALSRLPYEDTFDTTDPSVLVASTFSIKSDPSFLAEIIEGYTVDPWCVDLQGNEASVPGFANRDGLLYIGNRLVIPRFGDLREQLFRCAHDSLGHFGFEKSYGSLRDSYYWPNMRRDLEKSYVPACSDCQRNKGRTSKPNGPLHPLPVPDSRNDSVAIDFIGPLPPDQGFDTIVTMTDRLGSDIRIIPTRSDITAEEFAVLFFDNWYCKNGLPADIVSDCDKLFVSKFWKSLNAMTGVKLKMSTSYHPETDGSSERSNKTVNQCLRYHVERNQRGWVRALPRVHFDMMNTVNDSTGFSGFQLRTGTSPRIIPPFAPAPEDNTDDTTKALAILHQLQSDLLEAKDNLLAAKISQATQANKHRGPEVTFCEGDRVMLSTFHRRRDYVQKDDKRVAKFVPRFDGPYTIVKAFPEKSVYTLDLPNSPGTFPTFHASLLNKYIANDASLFPSRQLDEPDAVVTIEGDDYWDIEEIIDERKRGRGYQYLVRWTGYRPDMDLWLPRREVEDCAALDAWLSKRGHV